MLTGFVRGLFKELHHEDCASNACCDYAYAESEDNEQTSLQLRVQLYVP
jgi:hypothetical protein